MEFTIDDISTVKKKVDISVTPEEVNAALSNTVAAYKKEIKLDGFRKGKVPAAVVEKRFHDSIQKETREELVNGHIEEITKKLDTVILGGIQTEGLDKPLERGNAYSYSMTFEIMPKFDLPAYEGLEVEENEIKVKDDMVDRLVERVRMSESKLLPVPGNAPARDGQFATIDFQGFEDGKPVEGVESRDYNLPIGDDEALPEFVRLVKGIPVGHTGEGEITFPDDFIDPHLAGKTLTMRVTVHGVKEREIPPLDDAFAEKIGYENLAALKDDMRDTAIRNSGKLAKGVSQKKLLDSMLKQVDFELPGFIVSRKTRLLLADKAVRLQQSGKSLASLGKNADELIQELRPQAEEMARTQVLLLAIAKKEGLNVGQNEVNIRVMVDCLKNGTDFRSTLREMDQNGLLDELRDKMLEDKAMDFVYSKANVKKVAEENEAPAEAESSSAPEHQETTEKPDQNSAASDKTDAQADNRP